MSKFIIVLIIAFAFLTACDDATSSKNDSDDLYNDIDIVEIEDTDEIIVDEDVTEMDIDETEDEDVTESDIDETEDSDINSDEEIVEDNDVVISDEEIDEDTIITEDEDLVQDEDITIQDEDNELPDDDSNSISDLENLSGKALEDALYERYEPHTDLGYNTARDYMFNQVDVFDGVIECYYTSRTVVPNGSRTPGGFNTEHSWPQSQLSSPTPKADIHHLFPTDSGANSGRGSYDFGITDNPDETYCYKGFCSERGTSNTGSGTIFEVRPARRGDIARAHFYMAVIYKMNIDSDEEALLRTWNNEDPVDTMERTRNDRIELYQGNRNPFVDRPDFIDKISNF